MSLLSRSAERRSEYRTDAGIAPVRGKRFSLPAQSLSHNHCGGVGHPPLGCRTEGGERPPSQKITSTYPRSPILAYSSRVLSGGNASGNFRKSGKDRRFGFTGRKPVRPGRFGPVVDHWAKTSKTPGRVVPRIASIAYHIPKTRVPGTARLSHLSTARRNCGRGNGKTISPHSRTALALLRHAP